MRRRTQDAPEDWQGVPLRLIRYDPEDWGPGDGLTRAGRWWQAREAWDDEHGEPPPLAHDSPVPDAPFDAREI